MHLKKIIISGFLAGLTTNIVMFLTFRLCGFGINADGILLSSSLQSQKLIAVWTQLKPLPLVIINPVVIFIGMIFFGILHVSIYNMCCSSWPSSYKARWFRLSSIIFVGYMFWEFFTPFNLFGEPLLLMLLELIFWLIIAIAESAVIVAL